MELLKFMPYVIVSIALSAMLFGIISYYTYRVKQNNKEGANVSYYQVLLNSEISFLFFNNEQLP